MKHIKWIFIVTLVLAILAACAPAAPVVVTTEYVLTTAMRNGKFVFLGVDGDINGLVNPALHAAPGEHITVMLVNSGEVRVTDTSAARDGAALRVGNAAWDYDGNQGYASLPVWNSGTLAGEAASAGAIAW